VLKKTVTYEDFSGQEVTEDLFFHLTQAELIEMQMSEKDGLDAVLQRIIEAEDGKSIIAEFKKIILAAYGVKSEDGRRFIKTQELRDAFESSEAYSTLFMELVTDAEKAAEFTNGIVPAKVVEQATAAIQRSNLAAVPEPPAEEVEVRKVTRALMQSMSPGDLEQLQEDMKAGKAIIVAD
jgi:hypothetical protein